MTKSVTMNSPHLAIRLCVCAVLFIIVIYGCAHQRPPRETATQYRFVYQDATYRIRSITAPNNSSSYNELIGENFMAADYDQDQVIDLIVLGDVPLNEAQQIYEFGLNEVKQDNKLQEQMPSVNRYFLEKMDYYMEIRSFRPYNSRPFNEFKILKSRRTDDSDISVFADNNADGIIDDILK
ncbi:hypothetical protein JW960_14560 [candidate division KSB1 bacterium]|nr:hypothetical protein [candidate division KSB1 bacterium]